MKILIYLLPLLFTVSSLNAQRLEMHFKKEDINKTINEIPYTVDASSTPFIALSVFVDFKDNIEKEGLTLYYTTKGKTEILKLKKDGHTDVDVFLSELYFLPADAKSIKYSIDNTSIKDNGQVSFFFYAPGHTDKGGDNAELRELEDCECHQPDFQGRLDWCPDGSCPKGNSPVFTDVSHLIIHHSAGLNASNDWAARVRSIWDYHVNSNGWDDIGYNWMVAPDGTLFEGRGDDIRGAHFCGNNTNTQGVCMLGTYINDMPTDTAMTTLKEYLAWKSANDNIDPTDISFHSSSNQNIPHIAGHRDGCSTTCPGDMLYALMPQLIGDVRQHQARICGHPHSVTDLTATLLSNNDVKLDWVDNAIAEDAYLIQRAEGATGTFATIESIAADTEAFVDDETAPSTFYRYQVLSMAGDSTSTCQLEAEITTSPSTAVSDLYFNGNKISIVPNPTTDYTYIYIGKVDEDINYSLVNINGQLVTPRSSALSNSENSKISIDMSNLADGIYFLKLLSNNEEASFRIIKI